MVEVLLDTILTVKHFAGAVGSIECIHVRHHVRQVEIHEDRDLILGKEGYALYEKMNSGIRKDTVKSLLGMTFNDDAIEVRVQDAPGIAVMH